MPYMPIKSLTRENLIKLVENLPLFVRFGIGFKRNLQIHRYSVSMVVEDRFRPDFFLNIAGWLKRSILNACGGF